jgi:uncharacterized protein
MSAQNEGLPHDYVLPNETAYAETSASVALTFWTQRLLHLDLDGHYANVLECELYNGGLSGLSREGRHYFYANPLAGNGTPSRWKWHVGSCYTINVSRLIGSIGSYFTSYSKDEIAIHFYGAISTSVEL